MTAIEGSVVQALADGERSIILDLGVAGGPLLIAFGGLDLPTNRVFIRDLQCSWYHRGVPGSAARSTRSRTGSEA
jgi:hypothetical protein